MNLNQKWVNHSNTQIRKNESLYIKKVCFPDIHMYVNSFNFVRWKTTCIWHFFFKIEKVLKWSKKNKETKPNQFRLNNERKSFFNQWMFNTKWLKKMYVYLSKHNAVINVHSSLFFLTNNRKNICFHSLRGNGTLPLCGILQWKDFIDSSYLYELWQHSQLTGKPAICGFESSPDFLIISLVSSNKCIFWTKVR